MCHIKGRFLFNVIYLEWRGLPAKTRRCIGSLDSVYMIYIAASRMKHLYLQLAIFRKNTTIPGPFRKYPCHMFFWVPWIFVWSKVCKQGFLASFLHLILWVSPSNIKLSMLPGSWKLGGVVALCQCWDATTSCRCKRMFWFSLDIYLRPVFLSLSLFFNYIVYQMQYCRFVIFMSYHYFPGRRVEEKRGPRSQICRFGRYKPGLSSVLGSMWHICGEHWHNWGQICQKGCEGLKGLEEARYSWFHGLVKTHPSLSAAFFANWSGRWPLSMISSHQFSVLFSKLANSFSQFQLWGARITCKKRVLQWKLLIPSTSSFSL